MKFIGTAIVVAGLLLSGCDNSDYEAEQAEINAEFSLAECRSGMFRAESIHLKGGPKSEIREELEPCRLIGDKAFTEMAKKELTRGLKDPFSVEYKDINRSPATLLQLSGSYNAKNSYGAYVGWKRFTVGISTQTGKWSVETSKY